MAKYDGKLKLWAKHVKQRDKCCQICGKTDGRLHTHHIIPKQFIKYKYDITNGILLCFQHHVMTRLSVHQNAIWFSEWMRKNRPEQFKQIMERLDEYEIR